jgi:hypothetical protein
MPMFEGRAGGTYVDPFTSKQPPRLFTTPLAAKNALRWWLKGRVRMNSGRSGAWDEPDYGPEIMGADPVEGRVAADWEMITVHLEHGFPVNDSLTNAMTEAPSFATSGGGFDQERYRK